MPGIMEEFDRLYGDHPEEEQSEEQEQSADELSDDAIDDQMSEAEKRLAKAAYYKAVVRNGIVEDDGTELAAEVNEEAKTWGRYMMARLLNMNTPAAPIVQVPPLFSEREADALRKLAGIALAKMGMAPAEPVVKTVAAPKAPAVKKIAAAPKPISKQKPAAAPPKAPAATKQPKHLTPPKKADGTIDEDKIPSQTIFKGLDGKNYKFVDNPSFDPDIPGSKPRGKLCVDNQAARGANRAPMPSPQQMEQITRMKAEETVDAGQSVTGDFNPQANDPAGQKAFLLAAANALKE